MIQRLQPALAERGAAYAHIADKQVLYIFAGFVALAGTAIFFVTCDLLV